MNTWDAYYQRYSTEQIPWNNTQADFFESLLESGRLGQGQAIDIGCGIGRKAIALAENGWQVTGVDISPTALDQAALNVRAANVMVTLLIADAIVPTTLPSQQFDLVLDWAVFHCLPTGRTQVYVRWVHDHVVVGGKFLLRVFGAKDGTEPVVWRQRSGDVRPYSEMEITSLFTPGFRLIEQKRSLPATHDERWFDEYLFERNGEAQ